MARALAMSLCSQEIASLQHRVLVAIDEGHGDLSEAQVPSACFSTTSRKSPAADLPLPHNTITSEAMRETSCR
jgi:hypothetical protein